MITSNLQQSLLVRCTSSVQITRSIFCKKNGSKLLWLPVTGSSFAVQGEKNSNPLAGDQEEMPFNPV